MAAGEFRLIQSEPGRLDSLRLARRDRVAPASNEVEVEVHATGLNFKEVLFAAALAAGGDGDRGFRTGMRGPGQPGWIERNGVRRW